MAYYLSGRRIVLILGVVGLAVMAGSVAYATIPSGSGIYTACMLKGVGTIRMIDPSLNTSSLQSHCTSLEQQISWSQTGPAGQAGATGNDGATGVTGPTGATGATPSIDITQVENQKVTTNGGLWEVDATCPDGYTLIGGGAGTNTTAELVDDVPQGGNSTTTWEALYSMPPGSYVITSTAICENAG